MKDRLVRTLLRFRLAVLVAAALLPFSMPHVHRQTDTMGISARYWSRWALERDARYPLLPAVLNSGDSDGILATELPLLNLVTAPCFALGKHAGRAAAMLFLLLLLSGLWRAALAAWKGQEITGVDAARALRFLPLLSLSAVYAGKFMPDLPAMLLVLVGTGLLFGGRRLALAGGLVCAGLLVKPTSVVVLGLLLLHSRRRDVARAALGPVGAALAATLVYYLVAVPAVAKLESTPWIQFAVKLQPVTSNLASFLAAAPRYLTSLLLKRMFFLGGAVVVAAIHLTARKRATRPAWALLLAQALAVGALGGFPVYIHDYYFIGLAPTACVLFAAAWEARAPRWLGALLALGLALTALDLSWNDVGVFGRSQKARLFRLDRQCRLLVSRNPELPWGQGLPFRSEREGYPELGLCFLERSASSSARYGFFRTSTTPDAGCEIIDTMSEVNLVRCGGP